MLILFLALFFVDVKYKMFLWQGWWPITDEENEDDVGPTTAAEKHRFDVSRKLAMQSIASYAEGMWLLHNLYFSSYIHSQKCCNTLATTSPWK